MVNETEAGYFIENIFVSETQFKREITEHWNGEDLSNEVNINVDKGVHPNGRLGVKVTVSVSASFNSEPVYSALVTGVGSFIKVGEPQLTQEQFLEANAPAIVFPFLREHLSNLSLKAGVGNLLIQPVNFLKRD